jgi:hypothetical protein
MRERQTNRFQSAILELDRCAALQPLNRPGEFYQWERLSLLTERLKGLFDAFELEGDLGPVAEAVAAYQADLATRGLQPDREVERRLDSLWQDLVAQQPERVDVLVSTVPAAPPTSRPDGLLAVSPETLEAILKNRSAS